MAAPSAGTRTKPSGEFLKRGYRMVVGIGAASTINLFEKSTKPPGQDAGEPIDITTQWNDDLRTYASEALVTMTSMTFKAAYASAAYDEILAALNVETTITLFFPDGSTLAFYGYLQKFEPDEMTEKEQPTATCTIQPTNADPNTGSEENWVYTPPVGT